VSLARQAVKQAARSQSRSKPLPAPVLGWVSAQNQAAAKAGTALVLENWFPTSTGIKLWGGSQKHATVSLTDPCESVFTYIGGTTEKMFGATEDSIFDITSPVDADTPPAADVTGQTNGYYSTANFATVGGQFMYACNDLDRPQLYDGTTWTQITGVSTPAITGVSTVGLSHVSVYRNRLAFVQGGTMNVWFLPVDSIGGAAIQVSLAGVFKKGGSVLLTASWSLDSGDGLDDKFVVISTQGEFAVYQGSDPSDPADWSIVGVYDCPAPLGKNGTMRAGGDLIVLTEEGAVPISQAIAKDRAALALAAVSRNIQPDWTTDARQRRGLPWEIVKWSSRNRAIISCPVTGDDNTTPPWCYSVNLETGAWCKRTGWNTRCLTLYNEFVYFGSNDGAIYQADITGSDDGEIYYAKAVLAWDHLGAPGYEKTIIAARGQFTTQNTFIPQLSVSTDYSISTPSPPNVSTDFDSPGIWDVGVWDVAEWDTGIIAQPYNTRWVSIGQSGYVTAAQVQVSCGSVTTPSAELVIIDVLFEAGEVML
jgi:hypothetical protein